MGYFDENIENWINHFNELGADLGKDVKMSYMGWKFAISIWEAEPYNKICRAFNVKELKINFDNELFFRTRNVPKDIEGEWSVRLSDDQLLVFREKYGENYEIKDL